MTPAQRKRAGSLRHLVAVQQPSAAGDAYRQPVPAWTPLLDGGGHPVVRHAAVESLSGQEVWNAGQVDPESTHLVTLRYLAGLTTAMRLVFQGRVLNIASITDDEERHVWLFVECKELVGQAP